MIKAKLTTIIGSPLRDGWAHIFSNPKQNLTCSLAIKGENAKNIGHELGEMLNKAQFKSPSQLHNVLLDILSKAREHGVQLQFALLWLPKKEQPGKIISHQNSEATTIASNQNQKSFNQAEQINQTEQNQTQQLQNTQFQTKQPSMVAAAYQGKIILKRKKKIGTITESEKEIKIMQGSVRKHDELVLATSQSLQIEQSLRQLFKQPVAHQQIKQQLNKKIRMLVDNSLTAIALVKLENIIDTSFAGQQDVGAEKNSPSAAARSQINSQIKTVNTKKFKQDITNHLTAKQPTNKQVQEKKEGLNINKTRDKTELPASTKIKQTILTKKRKKEVFDKSDQNALLERESQTQKSLSKAERQDEDLKIKINFEPLTKAAKLIAKNIKKSLKRTFNFFKKKEQALAKKNQANIAKTEEKKAQKTKKKTTEKVEKRSKKNAQINSNKTILESVKKKFNLSKSLHFSFKNFQLKNIQKQAKKLNSGLKVNSKKLVSFILRPISNKEVYLKKNQSKKRSRILSIVLILILSIIAGSLYLRKIYQNQQQEAQAALQPAHQLLEEADDVLETDVISARDKTAEAISLITQQQKKFDHARFTQKYFTVELEKARSFLTKISGIIEVSQLEIFSDLREEAANFISSSVTLNQNSLFFLDEQQKKLAILNLTSQETTTVEFAEAEIIDLAASNDQLFLLGDGIHYFPLTQTDETAGLQQLKSEGDSDRDAILINFFDTYLYVFNPEKRNIYRYIVSEDDLSEPIGWLINKQGIKFDQITSMAVDGFIWLTDKNGDIIKLEKGEPLEFNISGLEQSFGDSIKIYADADTEFLYVLEPDKKRLVVLSPDGDFIKQITHQSLAGATHLAVKEELSTAFAVSGSIIYSVPLN